MLAYQAMRELHTRLLKLAADWPTGRIDLWAFIAEHAHIDARSVYNFAAQKPKMHNPRMSTLNGLERAIVRAEALVKVRVRAEALVNVLY